MQAIGRGKVVDPADERRMTQFDRVQEGLVQADEDRQLQRHRRASAQRIDVIALVEIHHLFLQLLVVVLELVAQALNLRLQALHLHHRSLSFDRQRQESDPDQHRDEDYVDAVIWRDVVEQFQRAQKNDRQYSEPAKVDRLGQRGIHRLQRLQQLGPDVDLAVYILSLLEDLPLDQFIKAALRLQLPRP